MVFGCIVIQAVVVACRGGEGAVVPHVREATEWPVASDHKPGRDGIGSTCKNNTTMKIPRDVFNYGVMFVAAPVLTYVVFRPSGQDLEKTLAARPEVRRAVESHNKDKVVKLILSQDAKKDEILSDLVKKGQR